MCASEIRKTPFATLNHLLTCVAGAARADVLVQRLEIACRSIETGRGVAGIVDGNFAEAGGESYGAGARERRCTTPDALAHPAGAAVLAA